MREGWWNDDYLILLDESEIATATARYSISDFLPEYEIIGLWFWDDFLVRDSSGRTYTIPTIAPSFRHLKPFNPPDAGALLDTDARFEGKVKWYVKPILFGGSPTDEGNVIWIDPPQHAELVRYWNNKFRDLTSYSPDRDR